MVFPDFDAVLESRVIIDFLRSRNFIRFQRDLWESGKEKYREMLRKVMVGNSFETNLDFKPNICLVP